MLRDTKSAARWLSEQERQIAEWRKQYEEERRIRCPFCNTAYEPSDFEDAIPVSYWGEDLHDLWCSHCDKDFVCKEKVTRTFETRKP